MTTIERFKVTSLLWITTVFFGVSVFAYPVFPGVMKDLPTSTALFFVMVVVLVVLHVSGERKWLPLCAILGGALYGLGLAYAWGTSGHGMIVLVAANPLISTFMRHWDAHNSALQLTAPKRRGG